MGYSKIVDVNGRPFNINQLKKIQTAETASILRRFADHPSSGLNLDQIARIMVAAEQGDLSALACLYEDMKERDGHIFAEMQKRENALLTIDRMIKPAEGANAKEKALAKAVSEWFSYLDVETIILNAAKAIGHGFSAQELEWQYVDKLRLPLFHMRPHNWFCTNENGDQLLLNDSSQDGAALWHYGWFTHINKAKSGHIGTAGLARVLVWPYIFKNFSVRDLAEFLEIYGLPTRVGTYLQGASEEEKDALLEALVTLGHDAAGIIPQGSEIKFEAAAEGTADNFKTMIDWCERTQSKIILGSTLTSQADATSNTNALGNVHNEVRHDLKVADAKQLENTFNRFIVQLCRVNGYTDIHPYKMPKFVFDIYDPADLKTFSEGVKLLVEAGVDDIPASWVKRKIGIPERQGDEPVLKRMESTAFLSSQAPTRYKSFAALSQNADEIEDPAQDALDGAGNPADEINNAMQSLIAPLVAALKAGQSPDDALDIVAASYPALDDAALIQLLEQAIFVSEIWGRLNATK